MAKVTKKQSSTDVISKSKATRGRLAGEKSNSPSLTKQAYERIRQDVLACRLTPGAQLNIADLSKHLPASLGAVREALARLTSEGLVVSEPNRGYRVTPLSMADLRDLTMTRIEVETLCLKRSIEHGDIAWESEVLGAYHRMSRIPQVDKDDPDILSDAWIKAHHEFHDSLVSACESPWLIRIRRLLFAQSERYRQMSLTFDHATRDTNLEHQEIMNAAIGRDAEAATGAMERHIRQTSDIIEKSIAT